MATKKSAKKSTPGISPLGDRVLIQQLSAEDKKTAAGIIIPDTVNQKKSGHGKVVAVGDGRRDEKGERIPMTVKEGDTVLFSEYSGESVEVDGEEYYIIREDNILAIIN